MSALPETADPVLMDLLTAARADLSRAEAVVQFVSRQIAQRHRLAPGDEITETGQIVRVTNGGPADPLAGC